MSPWFASRSLGELVLPPSFRQYCAAANMARGSLVKCFTGLLTLQSALGTPVKSGESWSSDYPSKPILKEGELGAVASESDICSHIGIELLKLGGNAADAMVGTVACVGVVGMYHSGKISIYTFAWLLANQTQVLAEGVSCLCVHQMAHTK